MTKWVHNCPFFIKLIKNDPLDKHLSGGYTTGEKKRKDTNIKQNDRDLDGNTIRLNKDDY